MKIDIIGSVASGKTTLARRISQKYGVPYYEKIILYGKEHLMVIKKELLTKETRNLIRLLRAAIG